MHLLVPVFGYNEAFDDDFVVNKLDWDALYKAVSTYLDADYFECVDLVAVELFDGHNENVIIMRNVNEVAYCGEGRWFEEWTVVKYIGSVDVHC